MPLYDDFDPREDYTRGEIEEILRQRRERAAGIDVGPAERAARELGRSTVVEPSRILRELIDRTVNEEPWTVEQVRAEIDFCVASGIGWPSVTLDKVIKLARDGAK